LSSVLEVVAGTISQGRLLDDPDHEAACDHIGALAAVDLLAATLVRYRHAGDDTKRRPLLDLLAGTLRKQQIPRMMARKLADRVLYEHMHPTCLRCNGKGVRESIINSKHVVICRRCNGTGLVAADTQARMRAVKASVVVYDRKYAQLFANLHNELTNAEGRAARTLARQLERGRGKSS
jgi:hypothetical protein